MRCLAVSIVMQALLVSMFATPSVADETDDVKACNAGSLGGCVALLVRYGGGVDPQKWMIYADKACDLKSPPACNNLGAAWSDGKYGAPRIDNTKAAYYYRRSCQLNDGIGCFNFGNVYRLGEGVPADPKIAFKFFKISCDLKQAQGCTELAIMYYEGKVVPKNVAMAKTLFDRSRRLGSQVGCKNADRLKAAPGKADQPRA